MRTLFLCTDTLFGIVKYLPVHTKRVSEKDVNFTLWWLNWCLLHHNKSVLTYSHRRKLISLYSYINYYWVVLAVTLNMKNVQLTSLGRIGLIYLCLAGITNTTHQLCQPSHRTKWRYISVALFLLIRSTFWIFLLLRSNTNSHFNNGTLLFPFSERIVRVLMRFASKR